MASCCKKNGFTLVELMAAAAVTAVGMVFVLGAFSQCLTSLTTAQAMVKANTLLNMKAWEMDGVIAADNGSEAGEWTGCFAAPDERFNFTRVVRDGVAGDFGNATDFLNGRLNEEVLTVSWSQGKAIKSVSVTRYVTKKRE